MGFEDFKQLSLNDSGKLHPLFQDPDADVTFESIDGTRFAVHRKYLELNTSAFPGAEFSTNGEITPLTERSAVLALLFQFVYPRRHPDLDELLPPDADDTDARPANGMTLDGVMHALQISPPVPGVGVGVGAGMGVGPGVGAGAGAGAGVPRHGASFEVLKELAEAAEKYEVFAAVGVCKMQMRRFVDTHPLDVLSYATRHDYPQLIKEVVPHLARRPALEIAELLPPRLILPWIRYRASWDALFDDHIRAISKMPLCITNPSRAHVSFGMSMPSAEEPQACAPCILAMLTQLHDLKALPTVKELQQALEERKKGLEERRKGLAKQGGGVGSRRCDISVCQYDFVFARCLAKIEERKREIAFLV